MTLAGSLLFVNLTNPHPFTLGVQALNLATQATTFVASFGPSGSFYDQVGTVSADGATYWASIQHTGAPIDPWSSSSTCSPGCASGTKCCVDPHTPNATSACFKVDKCSDLNGGNRPYGETVAIDLNTRTIKARMNSSLCYHLFAATADEVLCAAGTTDGSIAVQRIDTKAKTVTTIGKFDKGCNAIVNEVAAYDAHAGVFYAWLENGDAEVAAARGGLVRKRVRSTDRVARSAGGGACKGGLHAMEVSTAKLLPTRGFGNLIVVDIVIDGATGAAHAAVERETSPQPHLVWERGLVRMNLTDGSDPIAWDSMDADDIYGVQQGTSSSCEKGSAPGAAETCLYQLNNGALGNGSLYFLSAFATPTSQERVVVASTEAGRGVLLELDPKVGNMVDLAYTPISY